MVTIIIFLSLDTAPKPYYLVRKYSDVSAVTTALYGPAPASSTRAAAAPTRKASAPVAVMTWV
jgi:hypothetical protein